MSEPIDYYSYTPLVIPDKPLALVGLPAARINQTARLVSILTGLPLFLLDRAVEHRLGKDLRRVLLEDGEEARREAETALLDRPLAQSTPPVIALGSTTLLDETLRAKVLERCTVIYVPVDGDASDLDQLYRLVSHVIVPQLGRHEQRVAKQIIDELDLDVELP
ncbi:MAG: shikimate kinase [Myxococcota bacterium]